MASSNIRALFFLGASLIASLAPAASWAADCKNASSTPDIEACAKKELERQDQSLRKTFDQSMARLNEPDTPSESYSTMRKTLSESQRQWESYREAHCKAVYAHNMGGTIRGLAYVECKMALGKQRVQTLKGEYLDSR